MRHLTRNVWQPRECLCMSGLDGTQVEWRDCPSHCSGGLRFGFAHGKRAHTRNEQEILPCKP
jgi:hypothetical protein